MNLWAVIINNCRLWLGHLNYHQCPTLPKLQNNINKPLKNVPPDVRKRMWLQHNGVPAHYAGDVRQYFYNASHKRWTGRRGPIQWLPCSPDLNPIDYFLWGFYKGIFYEKESGNEQELCKTLKIMTVRVENFYVVCV